MGERMKQSWVLSSRLYVLLALLLAWTANAEILYVDPDFGPGGDGREETPFDSLQGAIGAASWGDSIRLLDDVDLDELTVGTGARFITIEGYDRGSPEPVNFDGDNQLIHASSYGLVLRRINFGATSTEGAGGSVYSDGPLTLEDCTFEYSDATGNGGAVYASSVSARNCVFDECDPVGRDLQLVGRCLERVA
jgi:predicted outer membrane repeat protein